MNPKKYLISYKWADGLDGRFCWHEHFETDSMIVMLLFFIAIKFKYGTISIDYRSM